MHTFDVQLSVSHANLALKRFLFRQLGRGGFFAVLGLALIVCLDIKDGVFSYKSTIVCTLLAVLIGVYAKAFLLRRKQFNEQLARLDGTPITYTLDDNEWSIKTKIGVATYKWNMIVQLWVYSDLTLLFYNHSAYVTIPTSQIPSEALDFMIRKVNQLSMPVVDHRKS